MPNEDLIGFAKVDPNSHLTVTSSKVTAVDLTRNEDAYVYKDFGADYFDGLDIDFEFYLDSVSEGNGRATFGLTNDVDDSASWTGAYIKVRLKKGAPSTVILDIGGSEDSYNISDDTMYYCTMQRSAGNDTVYLYIYSDASRTTLLDTLTMTGAGTSKYQYLFAICSWNSGNNIDWDGYVQNIDLNENPKPSIVAATYGLLAPSIGLYDTRFKLRARNRDTALTTRVRNT
jgi:hypothetical protein